MQQLLTTAVKGTERNNAIGNELLLLHEAGISAFQRRAGYIADKLPIDTPLPPLPPINENFASCAKPIMAHLCGLKLRQMKHVDVHIPYVLLAWILIGSDNPYRFSQINAESSGLCQMARFFLYIAVGGKITQQQLSRATLQADRIAARGWKLNSERLSKMGFALRKIYGSLPVIQNTEPKHIRGFMFKSWHHDLHFLLEPIQANPEAKIFIETRAREWLKLESDTILQHIPMLFITTLDVL